MQEISPNALLFSEEPWTRLAPLCRRICLLRAQGRSDEADALHASDFVPALAALRNDSGRLDTFDDERVRLLQAMEQERVTNALVLAELLQSMNVNTSVIRPTAPATPAHLSLDAPAPRTRPAVAPGIADLLDDMLFQERGRT
ncbi:MAG: hypothetical protein ACAH89_14440 [Rariglobus sp.]|nr:hypothetical protein [Rariglobus sp.]